MKRMASALSVATLFLSGCATVEPSPPHPLTLNGWQLSSITRSDGQTTRLDAAMSGRHLLWFRDDGDLQAKLDCNNGNGNWTATRPASGSGILTIGPVASTRALCPPPSYGEDMASLLSGATGYTLMPEGQGLTVITRNAVLAFTPGPQED